MTIIVASDNLTIDMAYLLDLLRSKSQSDPLLVFTELFELQGKILKEYGEYSDRLRGLKRDLKVTEAALLTRFSRKDQFNELLLEGVKVTAVNVRSAIDSNDEFIVLKEQIDNIQESKNALMGIKQLLDQSMDMVRALTQRTQLFESDLLQL